MGGGRGSLPVGAAGGFHWDAGQSGGPVEQVGAVWSLLEELWYSLNKWNNRTDMSQSLAGRNVKSAVCVGF